MRRLELEDRVGLVFLDLLRFAALAVYPRDQTLRPHHQRLCWRWAMRTATRTIAPEDGDSGITHDTISAWLDDLSEYVDCRERNDTGKEAVLEHALEMRRLILPPPTSAELVADGKKAVAELFTQFEEQPFQESMTNEELLAIVAEYQQETPGRGLFRGNDDRLHLSWRDMRRAIRRAYGLKRIKGATARPPRCTTDLRELELEDPATVLERVELALLLEEIESRRAAYALRTPDQVVLAHLPALAAEETTIAELARVESMPPTSLRRAYARQMRWLKGRTA